MTAKQIVDYAESIENDKSMFRGIEEKLGEEKLAVLINLEHNPRDKKLAKQYNDICEKLRMIFILRRTRLELLHQAGY